jgi:hypothetical protein
MKGFHVYTVTVRLNIPEKMWRISLGKKSAKKKKRSKQAKNYNICCGLYAHL